MINSILAIFKINSILKKKKVNYVFFADSFGGILEFFNLFELNIKNKDEEIERLGQIIKDLLETSYTTNTYNDYSKNNDYDIQFNKDINDITLCADLC